MTAFCRTCRQPIPRDPLRHDPGMIVDLVCLAFRANKSDLFLATRRDRRSRLRSDQVTAWARMASASLIRRYFPDYTNARIGTMVGYRTPDGVSYAARQTEALYTQDIRFRLAWDKAELAIRLRNAENVL